VASAGTLKGLLAALEAEQARRHPPSGHTLEQIAGTLSAMAMRLATTVPLHPLQVDDLSPAELLSLHFLAEHLRPPGLPSVDEIWAIYESRK
jgi:hypothetical protein